MERAKIMCGIVGICNLQQPVPIEERTMRQMLAMIRHRGSDQFGIYRDHFVGLGSARLTTIDLISGQQPITNEDGTLWIVCNGEIFNYIELRAELEKRGHGFTTTSDTEVILHLYEACGADCLSRLNGQFSLAIWDARAKSLFLGRDRCGVRPLFYTTIDNKLIFGSEIKALLAHPAVHAALDPTALDQIFTYWSTLSPRTIFQNIQEIPPGHYVLAQSGNVAIESYWKLQFPDALANSNGHRHSVNDYIHEFRHLLIDSTQIRLRADVPVGAYLGSGLESSLIATIVRHCTAHQLTTFSIAFDDAEFDKNTHQQQLVDMLGTEHHVIDIHEDDIVRVFPKVIWHTEAPLLRTAPVPMFMLSQLVHGHGYKVLLSGDGADEFLAGYDIFKEMQIRRFWARQPESAVRPTLLRRLYAYIPSLNNTSHSYLAAFFGQRLTDVNHWDYSHLLRWHNTARTKRFFSPELRYAIADACMEAAPDMRLPSDFSRWHPLHRAQYLEASIFLSQYLLSSQGDRMAMAHSVEGRYPFLDFRIVEFCNQLPPQLKLRGLTEKYLLRKLARELLPEEIINHVNQPQRTPIHRSFFNRAAPNYVKELLSLNRVKSVGLFDAGMVEKLVHKVERGVPVSETDDMALVGILSTQILHSEFISNFKMPEPLSSRDDVKICFGSPVV